MKNTVKLSAVALLLVGANAYAHHPAADIVDPEVYEMIEENISEQHLDLTFDDMGSAAVDAGGAMEAQNTETGAAAMEAQVEVSSMADVEPAGQMGSPRQ